MAFLQLHYWSEPMQRQASANVLVPDGPGPHPVMFLLHGWSDDHTSWMRNSSIERHWQGYPMIVVMPDGEHGWYVNNVQGPPYGTAIGSHLPQVIENLLHTKPGWGVAGLSMGGYGAVQLALAYPDRFRAAVSHSGAVMLGHSMIEGKDDWERMLLRTFCESPEGTDFDLYALIRKLPPEKRPALRIDCGVDDFLIGQNRHFHEFLEKEKIDHEYEEFPGEHTWEYWDTHVQEALAFVARHLGIERG